MILLYICLTQNKLDREYTTFCIPNQSSVTKKVLNKPSLLPFCMNFVRSVRREAVFEFNRTLFF